MSEPPALTGPRFAPFTCGVVLVSSLLALACSSVGDQSGLDAHPTPSDAGASDGKVHAWVREACARPAHGRLAVSSTDGMRDVLIGHWALCGDNGLFGIPQAGIDVGADDRWRLIGWSGDRFVRRAGLDNAGTVRYVGVTVEGNVQVDWIIDYGFTLPGFPTVSDDLRSFVFADTDGREARYVRLLPSVDAVADEPRPAPPVGGTGSLHDWVSVQCARRLDDRLWVPSPDEMRDVLVGNWALCSDDGVLSQPQAGIEVGDDDRWRLLGWSGDRLVRRAGLDNAGRMLYQDASQAGQVLVQVDSIGDYGFTSGGIPVVSDDPRIFVIPLDSDGRGPRYVRLSPSVTVGDEPRPAPPGPASSLREWVSVQCARPLGDRLWAQTSLEMHDVLIGRWALCGDEGGILGRPQDGIVVGADDRWHLLDWSGDDLVPRDTAESRGVLDYPSYYEFEIPVTWVAEDGWFFPATPVVSDDPRVFIVQGFDVQGYRYVRLP